MLLFINHAIYLVHEPNKNYKYLLCFYNNYFNILIKVNNGNYFFYIINKFVQNTSVLIALYN